MGRERPLSGCCELGSHNIVPNYFEQNQAEALDLNLTVLQTLVQAAPDAKINDLKQLLGRMLFSGTAMEKKVRARVVGGWEGGLIWALEGGGGAVLCRRRVLGGGGCLERKGGERLVRSRMNGLISCWGNRSWERCGCA